MTGRGRPKSFDSPEARRPGGPEPVSTHNLKRLGDYKLRMDRPLEGWIGNALFGQAARPARQDGPVSQPG
jgi:hypothetical protein